MDDFSGKFRTGFDLSVVDDLPAGDEKLASAIKGYTDWVNTDRSGILWQRVIRWVENLLFTSGRHYIDDALMTRLSRTQSGDLSMIRDALKNIPRPTNDMLGRWIETNVALLTENRPKPRVEPKSDLAEDEEAAMLSEYTLQYLWEALDMPQKHRQLARIILACGVAWMEIDYDPAIPRMLQTPVTKPENMMLRVGEDANVPPIELPITRNVPLLDKSGKPVYEDEVAYGDLVANVISPFEMHLPLVHWWKGEQQSVDAAGWIIREHYTSLDFLKSKYLNAEKNKAGLTRANGWNLDIIEGATKGSMDNIQNLPMWWWERLSQIVEGPGQSFYSGNPEQWSNHTIVRILDRKPNAKWPRGRTVIVVGDKVLYDSPKKVGARAYDPRWPKIWHPYTIFRWEPHPSNDIYCRSLLSKILPKIKRVNSIDTTLIMWRRTVPISTWIAPKGTVVNEGMVNGIPGNWVEYDPRRTNTKEPTPVYPPPFPEAALNERAQQLAEIEMIAGTEEILRGQRPEGVNSAAMLNVLRKQVLASRTPILQGWDESIEDEGSRLLQLVIRKIKDDTRFADGIRVLARDELSSLSIDTFKGANLSDNVQVRVDTASLALLSKEAEQSQAIEFMQFAPGFISLPTSLRSTLLSKLGMESSLNPQGPDVTRAKKMISWIKYGKLERAIPFPEDDPFVFYELFVNETKKESFWDWAQERQQVFYSMIDYYKRQIQIRQEQAMQMQMMMAQAGVQPQGETPGPKPQQPQRRMRVKAPGAGEGV